MTQPINVYSFFGMQGSGKSTQAKLVSEKLGWPYFNTGNELREASLEDSEFGKFLREYLKTGNLVEDKTIHELFNNFIKNNKDKNFITDGFPRNMAQYEMLKKLSLINGWQVTAIDIVITESEAQKRIASRVEVVGGKKIVRSDDRPDIVAKRIATYQKETQPLLDRYAQDFKLLSIDGMPPIEEVFGEVCRKLKIDD